MTSRRAPIKYGSARWRALTYLRSVSSATASDVGAAVWRDRSRLVSAVVRGEAARILLGRLRKLGFVLCGMEHASRATSAGSSMHPEVDAGPESQWSLTQRGLETICTGGSKAMGNGTDD